MEIAGLNIPEWILWTVGFIVFFTIFGRSVEWQLEARLEPNSNLDPFPEPLRNSRAKIEITRYIKKRHGTIFELFLDLPSDYSDKLTLCFDGKTIMNLPDHNRNRIRQPHKGIIPDEGSKVTIERNGEVLLSGIFYIDLGSRKALKKARH